jgi:hypothetical protein
MKTTPFVRCQDGEDMDRQIAEIADRIVDQYATRDRMTGVWWIDTHDIPDSDLNQLAGMMIAKDDDLAAQATGPDNDEWEKAMMPALTRALLSGRPPAEHEDFNDIWMSGVRAYLRGHMADLLTERLEWIKEDDQCHEILVWDRASEKVVELRV